MRWLKKILRIIAILLPCLAAIIVTPGVSAKSYSVNTTPIALPSKSLLEPFNLQFAPTTYTAPDAFYYSTKMQNYHCVYNETLNAKSSGDWSLSYSFNYYLLPQDSPLYPCRNLGQVNDTLYNELQITFPIYALGSPNFRDWDRYWFQYSGLYLLDSYTEDGLNQKSKLNFKYLFSPSMPLSFGNITLPLGLVTSDTESITAGTPILVQGRYDLGATDENDHDPNWGGEHFIRVKGFLDSTRYENDSSSYFDIPCALTTDWNEETWIATRSFYCKGESTFAFDSNYPVGLTLMSRLGSDTYLWDMPIDFFVFDYIDVVLNNDTTPAGNLNPGIVGGETIKAPGNILNPSYGNNTESDWFTSLVNQFQFSLANPFAGIFALFTDGDQCAHIPTIAGMLHAESDEYCPWFDSQTRNIVTPVVALSSAMLVFGFIIRWLGSDSGNFIEDRMGSRYGSGNTYIKGGNNA